MHWSKTAFATHRWLGLIVSLQLLAWSVGGFMFSILDIDNVHGDLERSFALPPPLRLERVLISPNQAIQRASATGIDGQSVVCLTLHQRLGRTVYELLAADRLPLGTVDAETGQVVRRITAEQARETALADFAPTVAAASVAFLEGDPPLEYRGRPMPVYRVALDHPKGARLYVSPVTGEVLARRNDPWRLFDFFWMLHIMDYGEREDFNHWLLSAMSALAILTSASGLVLWSFGWRRRVRGRPGPPGPTT